MWVDQYVTEPFEQQQFGTAGVEGYNKLVDVITVFLRLTFMYYEE